MSWFGVFDSVQCVFCFTRFILTCHVVLPAALCLVFPPLWVSWLNSLPFSLLTCVYSVITVFKYLSSCLPLTLFVSPFAPFLHISPVFLMFLPVLLWVCAWFGFCIFLLILVLRFTPACSLCFLLPFVCFCSLQPTAPWVSRIILCTAVWQSKFISEVLHVNK